MNVVAAMPAEVRADLFRETGDRRALPAALIEKDFWVCWTLKQLFAIIELEGVLMFKGGTSLSKSFGLIQRFSEDIDLAVNYAPLGFTGTRDPRQDMSRNQREKLLEKMTAACHEFIAGTFLDSTRAHFSDHLRVKSEWSIELSKSDPNTVVFSYPLAVEASVDYVRPAVVLELGTHAELIPSDRYAITPYAAEEFPGTFREPTCHVMTIKAERTFWEKATILHVECHRTAKSPMPARYSRHYYDMAMLAASPIRAVALRDLALLERVVRHKKLFYPSAWAKYDLAVPGTLRLFPEHSRLKGLHDDYDKMNVMIFGEPPAFETILNEIRSLENEINGHSR